MKIELQNIGMIANASIDIRGISLIAGPNDSGKSTIGKILYSIFRAINISEDDFLSNRNRSTQEELLSIFQQIARYSREKDFFKTNGHIFPDLFPETSDKIEELMPALLELNKKIAEDEIRENIDDRITKLQAKYQLKFDDKKVILNELETYLSSVFKDGLKNKFSKSKKSVITIEELSKLEIDIQKDITIKGDTKFLFNDVIFIESPLIIKSENRRTNLYTRDYESYLLKKINNVPPEESIFNNNKNISKFIIDIQKIINGKISKSKGLRNQLLYSKQGIDFSMNDTATGIKAFGVIQLLLENGSLNEKTLLIIDEPEVHLHPDWQVKFAEILVLLSKKLNIQMLLTSHSPYFIEAIEEFSKKYSYEKQTNFYLTHRKNDGLISDIINVTDETSPLLRSLTDAFYKIQDINNGD